MKQFKCFNVLNIKSKVVLYIHFDLKIIKTMEAKINRGTTQKGQKLIIFNGNEFTKKLATKTTTHWRCSKWCSLSSKARIVTCADRMLSNKNEHSHDILPGKPEARQIAERMKFSARNEQDPVDSAVIATQVTTVDEVSVQLSKPSRSALNRTLNRQKKKNNENSKVAKLAQRGTLPCLTSTR